MATELTLDARLAQWIVQGTMRLLATYAILQGGNIILGGVERWSADAFAVAKLLPGAPPSWGVLLFVCGVVALAGSLKGRHTPVVAGMLGCSVWSGFFALSFFIVMFQNPRASSTGVFAYGTFCILFALMAVAYRESRKALRPTRKTGR